MNNVAPHDIWVTKHGKGKRVSHLVKRIEAREGELEALTWCHDRIRTWQLTRGGYSSTRPEWHPYASTAKCSSCLKEAGR